MSHRPLCYTRLTYPDVLKWALIERRLKWTTRSIRDGYTIISRASSEANLQIRDPVLSVLDLGLLFHSLWLQVPDIKYPV